MRILPLFYILLLDAYNFIVVFVELDSLMRNFRLVNAATGTGKTVAYLAPIIHHLQSYDKRIQRSDGTYGSCLNFFFVQIHLSVQLLSTSIVWVQKPNF